MALIGTTVSPSSGVNSGTGGGMANIQPVPPAGTGAPSTGGTPPATGNNSNGYLNADGSVNWGGILGGLLNTGANIYGSQNAAQNISNADRAAIGTQTQTLGNINSLFAPQTALGAGAMSTLGSTLGVNGQPADYSNFLTMPGYQFAVQQGTQALQRQASASGNAYTPNTGAAIGQYVAGTAMQDYNTYVNQLLSTSQLGAQANNTLAGANLNVGANISQLQQNSGMAQASGVSNAAGSASAGMGGIMGLLNGGANYLTGGNGGVSGAIQQWLSGGNGVSAGQWSSALGGLDSSTGTQLASDFGNISSDTMGTLNAASAGGASSLGNIGLGAGGTGAGVMGDLGLSGGAGAGAATGGIDTMSLAQNGYASLGGVPGSLATADTSAGAAGAGTSAAGVSPMVGALPAAAMLAIAAHQNPTALSQSYWNGLNKTLSAGPGSGTPNWGSANALDPIAQKTQYEGALADLASTYAGQGNGNSTIPDSEWQYLATLGITPQNIGNLSMPYIGQSNLAQLSASTGVPLYSTPGRQHL